MTQIYKFKDICQLFDGPHATPKPSETGPIFLGIKNISEDGSIIHEDVRHISYEEYPQWTKRVTPKEGDIVFSYEATLHLYCMIPKDFEGCLGRRMALLRVISDKVNGNYLYHYLRSDKWKEYISQKIIYGSTVDRISIKDFPDYVISLPDIAIQNKVATCISQFDDLIENNNRRIAVLGEMAQRLYREWFLNFRFPGHEKIELMESELGMIPEGWGVKRFDQIAKFRKGKKAAVMFSENHGEYVKNILLDAVSSENYSFVLPEKMVLVDPTDTIMVMDGASSGKVIIGEDGAVGSTLAKIETSCEYKLFLFMFLANAEKEIMDNNTGSAIPHANKDFINMLKLIIPDSTLLKNFNSIVQPLFIEMQTLRYKNANLRKTRDLLSPCLISGDIDISNSDILDREE